MQKQIMRAMKMSFIVGSILIIVNQGDNIIAGDLTPGTLLKILITPIVPFCVSMFSQILAQQAHSVAWEKSKNAAIDLAKQSTETAAICVHKVRNMAKDLQTNIKRVSERATLVYEGLSGGIELFQKVRLSSQDLIDRIESLEEKNKEQLLTSTKSMDDSVKKVKNSMNDNRVFLDKATEQLHSSLEEVENSLQSATNLENNLRDIHESAVNLNENSKSIQHITNTITEIANSTNMLAINAAIEASKAGEHGIGFAVVAEEVRKLADKTKDATHEIANFINGNQGAIDKTIKVIENGKSHVENTRTTINTCRNQFQGAMETIRNVLQSFQDLEKSSEENFDEVSSILDLARILQSENSKMKTSVENLLQSFPKVENSLEESRIQCDANRKSPSENLNILKDMIEDTSQLENLVQELPANIIEKSTEIQKEVA